VVNHLNEQELLQAISGSSFIISRSGYTTVMEMMTLQKKCIFIPTPGQTEQEYLATHLQHQQYCLSYQQSTFHLDKALKIAENFSFQFPQLPSANLQTFIIDFLQRIA
jgi:UDP-N-acetylglucosamine:LPS N-acetylglucosamine transferase